MNIKTIFLYLMLSHYVSWIICENYYSVIAPGLMKSNRKYTVVVTLHQSNTPCTIRVSVTGRSYNISEDVQVEPFETKKIEFFPPKLENGDYELVAEGVNGCVFRNQSKLLVDSDAGPKIYIQTDKSVYKPKDLVQFRVVILDEHTRPVNIREPIRVEIFDNDKNRVKQFKDIVLTKGVFTGQVQLSQQPVMGKWEIRVTISGKYSHQNSKEISVQFYTLPKFSVYIQTDENLILDEPHIEAEIYGKYTFDKYVEGILNVELRDSKQNTLIDQKTMRIDGLVLVEFNVNRNKLFGVETLYLQATLEENDTGVSKSYSQTITVRKDLYKIFIPEEEIEFRNNKPFRLRVHIEHWNDGPIWDLMTPVRMQYGKKSYETYLNEEGVAVFEFEHRPYTPYIVKFKETSFRLPEIFLPYDGNDRQYCKIFLKEGPRLGKPLEVQVRSSHNIPYLIYTVVGHASIVRMDHIKLWRNRKFYTIKITPSVEMIPKSYLLVYYILDGNLRYDEITLKFPPELENEISLTAPKQVKPGQEVTLNLKAQPNSYVSILAVDLSVYLLDKRYDLYKKDILHDLEVDKSYIPDDDYIQPGIISGLITLTNAHYPIKLEVVHSATSGPTTELDFRTKFPETWIFKNYIINNTETAITLNIPETITTWRITAFSNNGITGFGIVDAPTDITTILPFFITFDLPHSAKRDEIIIISVKVFNYHNQSLDTTITMFNDHSEFHFTEHLPQYSKSPQQPKRMTIDANRSKTMKFPIKPSELGEIEIRVTANNSLFTDGIIKKLNVIPEGITKYQNKAIYINTADDIGDLTLTLDIPQDIVRDSEYITLAVGEDFMIPTLENLNDMIKMPTGCGEQNMANFAANVLILDYLKATGRYLKELKLVNEAKNYIDMGYQQQLSYRHQNGGYSVFGDKHDEVVSTWLTAYVTRFLIKASKYTAIESHIIDSALKQLVKEQSYEGSFPLKGYLIYKELQNSYSLTAFVLLTFMEDRKYSRKYQLNIQKGLEYLSTDLHHVSDIYSLSLMATALSKAKHPGAQKIIEKLQKLRKENENGLMWWNGNPNDVEITAYILMSLRNTPGNHSPILKWLIEQRNDRGGFKSSQDTVVGLEALVKFSQLYKNADNRNLKIIYSAQDLEGNEKEVNEFIIDRENALVLQKHELPKFVRQVQFKIEGSGYSLVQLSSQYNIKNDVGMKYFTMKVNPNLYDGEEMDLEICFTYHALRNSTNMVIMEANLPTGFKTESEFSRDLVENEFIQRIETKDDDTKMLLYFDKLSTDVKHCVTIESFKANEVKEYKPAAVVMYDYYNTSRFNSEFYTI